MEYLLVMSLSGSTMTVVYLLMCRFLWDKVSARLYYLLARVAVLYYLVPLPFLKEWYRTVAWRFLQRGKTEATRIPLIIANYAVLAHEKSYINIYTKIQAVLIVLWLIGVFVRIGKLLPEYVRKTRRCARYAEKIMTDRHREVISEFRKKYKVKRRIALYRDLDGEPTMTFGLFRPVIVCSREPGSHEAELLLHHEMVHIRRLDILWEMLLEFAVLLHWWNPIMKKLYRDFERVCECSCDETAMQGKSREEVKEYLHLLIGEARGNKKTKKTPPRWRAGFGDNAEKIKERMENLMKNKKWNRFAVSVLVVTLAFANSMTVFAYRDTHQVEAMEESSQEDIEAHFDPNVVTFLPDETEGEDAQEFELMEQESICYDRQFTDEEGNIYPVVEDDSIEPHCNHSFIWGTYEEHIKNSGGGCTVKVYRAQRCVICGYVKLESLENTVTYAVCPH